MKSALSSSLPPARIAQVRGPDNTRLFDIDWARGVVHIRSRGRDYTVDLVALIERLENESLEEAEL